MKRIHLLRPGTFTDMGGQRVTLSAVDLAGCAAAYDPKLQEAPIVVGHPDDKAPAYGWAQSLAAGDDGLTAVPHQLDPGFVSLVEAGRFKKVSASLYPPKHPSNPKPGSYYLRHIGFLGAEPPAVKGLKAIELAGDSKDCITIELSEAWNLRNVADLFRSLRDWLIGKEGKEAADKVLPDWQVNGLQSEAAVETSKERPGLAFAEWTAERKPSTADIENAWLDAKDDAARLQIISFCQNHQLVGALPAPAIQLSEQHMKTQQEIDAERAKLEQQKAEQDAREARIAASEKAERKRGTLSFVEGLVSQGRVHPREKNFLVELMTGIDASTTLEFAEADGAAPAKVSQIDRFKKFLGELPKVVDMGEHKDKGAPADPNDPIAINLAAQSYIAEQAKTGRVLNIAQAITELKNA